MAVMVMILNHHSLYIFNSKEYSCEKRVEECNKVNFVFSNIGSTYVYATSNLLL